jgi:hydroxymethylbilane synthase
VGDGVIRIGTRGSALARVQTEQVAAALRGRHADLLIEMVVIATSGDRSQHTNVPSPDWGSGVFVKELEAGLLRGDIDLAVHSLKDVPPDSSDRLALVAFLEREDPRDVLVTPAGQAFEALVEGARVGTSSIRRSAFLRAARPDLAFLPIRGNVETRLRKLLAGEYDAIVLARAGLRRLRAEAPHVVLEPDLLPPAPGQGALVVQARADDTRVADLVAPLNDQLTAVSVCAERQLMARLEGGCRLPVGALATPGPAASVSLLGGVAAPDGSRVAIERADGRLDELDALVERVGDRLVAIAA